MENALKRGLMCLLSFPWDNAVFEEWHCDFPVCSVPYDGVWTYFAQWYDIQQRLLEMAQKSIFVSFCFYYNIIIFHLCFPSVASTAESSLSFALGAARERHSCVFPQTQQKCPTRSYPSKMRKE